MFKHGLTIGPSGAVRPCCALTVNGPNLYIDDDWEARHLSWHEQSKTRWLPECEECRLGEQQNGESLRTRANDVIKDSDGIVYWDLKINNTCNLACRMCDAWSSSTWERISRENPDLDSNYHAIRRNRWHRDINTIVPKLLDAKVVKFTGGEPFLIPQVKKVIEYLIEHEVSEIIDLSFTTNGTQNIIKWLPMLNKFKRTDLVFSIDAIGERFEYIRSGAKWDQVSQNVINLKNQTMGTNIEISVIALPQALNKHHIDDVKHWCYENNIAFSKSPPLIFPDFMRPEALDNPDLKRKLIENMKKLDLIYSTDYRNFIDA